MNQVNTKTLSIAEVETLEHTIYAECRDLDGDTSEIKNAFDTLAQSHAVLVGFVEHAHAIRREAEALAAALKHELDYGRAGASARYEELRSVINAFDVLLREDDRRRAQKEPQ